VWQSFAKIGPGTSKNLRFEKDKTRPKYNNLPLSLERYAGDCKKPIGEVPLLLLGDRYSA